MRILHGITDAAGQGIYSVKGLKELGCDARMAVYADIYTYLTPDYALGFKKDKPWLYPWYLLKQLAFLRFAMREFDVFHFHFGHSLLIGDADLAMLKRKGKKIFFEFHGSDLRKPSLALRSNPYFPSLDIDEATMERRNAQRLAFADGVILHDEELIEHLPAHNAPVYIVPLRADLSMFEANSPTQSQQAKRLLITHAPSVRAVKGTDKVIEAVRHLSKRYDIEMLLIENTSHDRTIELLSKADIVVDQLLMSTYGVFAIEGMAAGKPVITSISEEMRTTFPESLPLVAANPDTLEDTLERLINNASLRHELGIAGRAYATHYHDYHKNAKLLMNIYEGTATPWTKETREEPWQCIQ